MYRHLQILLIIGLATPMLRGSMIIDSGFDSGFVNPTNTVSTLAGDTRDIGGDGFLIDDGWFVNGGTQGAAWDVNGSGAAFRNSAANRFSNLGFGQIVTSTLTSGDSLTFSFDFEALTPSGLAYQVYGVLENPGGAWLDFAGDGVNLSGTLPVNVNNGDTGNYDLISLVSGLLGNGIQETGSFSESVTLTANFDYFVVGFSAELDSLSGALAEVDNVFLGSFRFKTVGFVHDVFSGRHLF